MNSESVFRKSDIHLELDEVDIVYHQVIRVFNRFTLKIYKGSFVGLLGTNGAGKTTILRALSGLLKMEHGKITQGKLIIHNHDMTDQKSEFIVKMGVVLVPEGRQIFNNLTVMENLIVSSIRRSLDKKKINREIESVLAYFPKLKNRLKNKAGYCSGGEQQMLAIGRALMSDPNTMLLDEPSLGLAPDLSHEIFSIIYKIWQDKNITILMVEQNANLALEYATYSYIMEDSKIVLSGESSQLKKNSDVQDFYLGINKLGENKSFKDSKSYIRKKRWI